MISSKKSLLIWAYAIGCFDLISALLFSMVSLKTICEHVRLPFESLYTVENLQKSSHIFPAKLANNFCRYFWPLLDNNDCDAAGWHSWGIFVFKKGASRWQCNGILRLITAPSQLCSCLDYLLLRGNHGRDVPGVVCRFQRELLPNGSGQKWTITHGGIE